MPWVQPIISHIIERYNNVIIQLSRKANSDLLLTESLFTSMPFTKTYRLFLILSRIIDNPLITPPGCFFNPDVELMGLMQYNHQALEVRDLFAQISDNGFPSFIFGAILLFFAKGSPAYNPKGYLDFSLANNSLKDLFRTVVFMKVTRDKIRKSLLQTGTVSMLEVGCGPWGMLSLWAHLCCLHSGIAGIKTKMIAIDIDSQATDQFSRLFSSIISTSQDNALHVFLIRAMDGTSAQALHALTEIMQDSTFSIVLSETCGVLLTYEPVLQIMHALRCSTLTTDNTVFIPYGFDLTFSKLFKLLRDTDLPKLKPYKHLEVTDSEVIFNSMTIKSGDKPQAIIVQSLRDVHLECLKESYFIVGRTIVIVENNDKGGVRLMPNQCGITVTAILVRLQDLVKKTLSYAFTSCANTALPLEICTEQEGVSYVPGEKEVGVVFSMTS